jgi:hypothetical protein
MGQLPAPKDPVTVAIEKSIEEAADAAKEFAGKLLEPGLAEGGGLIKDQVAFWRFKNQIRIVLKAKKFLESKGIEPRRVLPKTFAPILETGSLEHEESMADIWAAMLANAADSTRTEEVLPAYPRILADLTSLEVRILEKLYPSNEGNIYRTDFMFDSVAVALHLEPSSPTVRLAADNLDRLGLIEPVIEFDTRSLEEYVKEFGGEHSDDLLRVSHPRSAALQRRRPRTRFKPRLDVKTGRYRLTTFGVDFIDACRRKP